MRLALALVSMLLIAATCEPPITDPTQDPAWVEPDAGADGCSTTCEAYRRLGCEEGEPTEAGASCEDVCANATANGYALAREKGCLDRAQTCDAARDCPKSETE